jgi:hypothetical protein
MYIYVCVYIFKGQNKLNNKVLIKAYKKYPKKRKRINKKLKKLRRKL